MERKPNRSMWDPLSEPLFRALWIAALASNIGSWMHDVAAAWLMTSLSDSPIMISLMQTASFLPFFLLALPAGAFADIFNRRSVLIFGQAWMLVAATGIGVCSVMGIMNPWLLLSLTLMLGIGGAISSPAWNAALPELVSRKNLEGAIALGGMGWNIARGVGSAIGGLIVAMWGPGAVFLINALSFLAVLWVFFSWKREPAAESTQNERVLGAIRAGVRFVRHSPVLLAVLWRTVAFVAFSTAFWALLPLFCRMHLHVTATEYGILLSAFGVGAICGAGMLPRFRKTMSLDACAAIGTVLFALAMLGLAISPHYFIGLSMSALGGIAWIAVTSSLNMGAQLACPAWVRSRALSVYILVWHGTMAIASLSWGTFAKFFTMENALIVAAAGLLVSLLLAPRRHKLGDLEHVDMSASTHWPDPVLAIRPDPEHGPVQVTVEYLIAPEKAKDFVEAMTQLAVQRRRDGAFQWHLMCDLEEPNKYVETYFVETWAEHERQHQRVTIADKAAEERVAAFHMGTKLPQVRHLISGVAFAATLDRAEVLPGTEPGEPPCGVCSDAETVTGEFEPSTVTGEVPALTTSDTTEHDSLSETGEHPVVKPPLKVVPASREGDSLEDFLSDLGSYKPTKDGDITKPAASAKVKEQAGGDGDSLADFLSDLGSHNLPLANAEAEEAKPAPEAEGIEALFRQDPGDTLTKIRPLRSPEWVDTFDGIERPIPRDGNVVDIDSLFEKQDRLHVVDDDSNESTNSPAAENKPAQSLFDLFDSFEETATKISNASKKPADKKPPEPEANGDAAEATDQEKVDTLVDIEIYTRYQRQTSNDTLVDFESYGKQTDTSDTLIDMDAYRDPSDTLVDIQALSRQNPRDRLHAAPSSKPDQESPRDTIPGMDALSQHDEQEKLTAPSDESSPLCDRLPGPEAISRHLQGEDETGDDFEAVLTGEQEALNINDDELLVPREGDDADKLEPAVAGQINTGELEALQVDESQALLPWGQVSTGEMEALEVDESESLLPSAQVNTGELDALKVDESESLQPSTEVCTGELEALEIDQSQSLSRIEQMESLQTKSSVAPAQAEAAAPPSEAPPAPSEAAASPAPKVVLPPKTEVGKSDDKESNDKPPSDKPLVKRTTTDLKPSSADLKPRAQSKPEPKLITTDKSSEMKPTVVNQKPALTEPAKPRPATPSPTTSSPPPGASDRTPVVPMPAYQGRTDSYTDDRDEEEEEWVDTKIELETKIELAADVTAPGSNKNGSNGNGSGNGGGNGGSSSSSTSSIDQEPEEVHAVTGETQAYDAFTDDELLLRPDDDTDD